MVKRCKSGRSVGGGRKLGPEATRCHLLSRGVYVTSCVYWQMVEVVPSPAVLCAMSAEVKLCSGSVCRCIALMRSASECPISIGHFDRHDHNGVRCMGCHSLVPAFCLLAF